MSLINDLLRDLEERRGGNRDRHEAFAGLAPVQEPRRAAMRSHDSGYVRLALWLLALLALAGIYFMITGEKMDQPRPAQVAMAPKPADGAVTAVKTSPDAPAPNREFQPAEPRLRLDRSLNLSVADYLAEGDQPAIDDDKPGTNRLVVHRVDVEHGDSHTQARIALSDKPDYQVYRLENPQRLVVEIAGAQSADPVIDNRTGDLVRAVRTGRHDDHLKLVFDLTRPVRVGEDTLRQAPDGYELAIVMDAEGDREPQPLPALAAKFEQPTREQDIQEIEAVHHGQMDKRPRDNNPASLAQKRYREGMRSYRQGRLEDSIESLAHVIQIEPRHAEARYLLASAYIRQQRPDKGIALLAQSVDLLPEDVRLKRLYAQILYELGQPAEAIRVLRTAPPAIEQETEYYALLAALLRDQARHAEAADIYRSLVRIAPEKSVWWIGLGVSLESIGVTGEALDAYRQALSGEALSGDLRQYVSQRIQTLTAEQRT